MKITIRFSSPNERDVILEFIEEMGSRRRDRVTWDTLGMVAATAWEGKKLIGAIPVEPRSLQIAPGAAVKTVHETAVAVRPEFRGHGIGSRLQQAIFSTPPGGALLMSVFREQPESDGYRWYRKNGFEPMMHIDSWFLDHPTPLSGEPIEWYEANDVSLDFAALRTVWKRWSAPYGGYISRSARPLHKWLTVHPYRTIYRFTIVVIRDQQKHVAGYAVLGIGKLYSETDRVDILELVTVRAEEETERLFRAVVTFAAAKTYRPIRWPLAKQDPNREIVKCHGLRAGWNFDFLIRRTEGAAAAALDLSPHVREHWRYLGIEYI